MNFRDAWEHYRNGCATEEEKKTVEEELEKNQLIAEYLDELFDVEPLIPEISRSELGRVKKDLRRRNIWLVLTSIVLVITILAGAVQFLVPLVESRYWNPSAASYSADFTDLEFTLRAYSELFVPNQAVCEVKSAKNGFAAYDLSVTFREYRNRNRYSYQNTSLVQSQLAIPEGMWEYAQPYYFCLDGMLSDTDQFSAAKEALHKMPEYVMVRAYVTFPEDLDMEGVMAVVRRVGSSKLDTPGVTNWIGIRAQKDGEDIYPLCGMKPFYANDAERFGEINESYPFFSLFDLKKPVASSEAITQHFKSILNYSMDQTEKGSGLLPESGLGTSYYQAVLDYVEENGVYAYGCSITTTSKQMLELMDDGTVSAVFLDDAWIGLR